jgi:hypothetical protein
VEIGKGLGTGARLQALAEGKIQIALASHGIKPEDVQEGNLKAIEVAKGAILFAVNASIPMTNITEPQVKEPRRPHAPKTVNGSNRRLRGVPGSSSEKAADPPVYWESHAPQAYKDVT